MVRSCLHYSSSMIPLASSSSLALHLSNRIIYQVNCCLFYLGVLSGLMLLIVLNETAYLASFLSYATQVCSNL